MRRVCMVLLLFSLAEYFAKAEKVVTANDKNDLDWWKTAVFYQIYPRSFKDSNGDGIGDLKGIEEKTEHFKDMGVDCIWLSPVFKSPMADFGYDISDYRDIDGIFGTVDDLISLQKKLKSLGIKIILDFVPNHSSDEHEWFKKSVEKIDPYTDYYVWKDAKVDEKGERFPPNNWQSIFSGPAWTWNETRGQYYLHQFVSKQPDLNYRNKELVEEMKNNIRFWLDRGVDGFRVDAVPFLFEDPSFPDEPEKTDPVSLNQLNTYRRYDHPYTMDLNETYDMISQFRDVMEEYTRKDGKTRVMITEGYTNIENVMRYYGNDANPGAHLPFNFGLIDNLNARSKAKNINDVVRGWLNKMPKGKSANWVIGNHDQPRVATRFGEEMVDAMNMLNLLLPGAAFTYMGEEIGMSDGEVDWDRTVDPSGINAGPDGYRTASRDPARTPYQWNGSDAAGFTAGGRPWLPVNVNYWTVNLEVQKNSGARSHYSVYKSLIGLRRMPTMRNGSFDGHVLSDLVYAFTRSLPESETYLVVINLGAEDEHVHLSDVPAIKDQTWYVHTPSVNSQHYAGESLKSSGFMMRPKSSMVLINKKHTPTSLPTLSSSQSLIYPSAMSLVALGFILANRYGILGA